MMLVIVLIAIVLLVIAMLIVFLTLRSKNKEGYTDKEKVIYNDVKTSDAQLFFFSGNEASPSCCPAQFSTSTGCICLTQQQKDLLATRGNNAYSDNI